MALNIVCRNDENKVKIREEGGIKPLIELVKNGTDGGKEKAASALVNLSYNNDENEVKIAKEGGIIALLNLIDNGTSEAKESAAIALYNLSANNSDNKSVIRKSGLDIITNAYENESNNTTKYK
jgi:hypothetical protein